MMTTCEMAASARLMHWWELHGPNSNPIPTIRRIASEVAPRKPQMRHEVEARLHDTWALLCAQEGADNE